MPIERSSRVFSPGRMARLARELLNTSKLCAVATVSPGGGPHVNTAYFAYTHELEIVWISEPGARHSRNLRSNKTAGIAVFDSHQRWGGPDRGIQLFGSATQATGARAVAAQKVYGERFPGYAPEENSAYVPYRFRPRRLKLFDETTLGTGVFVTGSVKSKGQVTWERTEIYQPR
jgi:uncharacterized protein YhbP (UPF0306 family)